MIQALLHWHSKQHRMLRFWKALLVTLSLTCASATSHAQDCGAVGGNNGPTTETTRTACDPNTEPAIHPNTEPTSASRFPIDLITGNKYLTQTDTHWPGGLMFARHYNSRHEFATSLGPAWRHSFDTVLAMRKINKPGKQPAWEAQIIQGDGRRIVFRVHANAAGGALFKPVNPMYGALRVQPDGPPDRRYAWRWRDGSVLHFSVDGQLTAIDRRNGHRLSLHYADNPVRLIKVQNRYGQALRLEYDKTQTRLAGLVTPDGRELRYDYDASGVLASVERGAHKQWQYSYADDRFAALVTVRDANGDVAGQFEYDAQGRANFSAPGDAGITGSAAQQLAIRVRYTLPVRAHGVGKSTVSSQQGTTEYRWRYDQRSQNRQLLSSQGERCNVCPPVNLARDYDGAGRLTALRQLDGAGRSKLVRRWHYDRHGRLAHQVFYDAHGTAHTHRYHYASAQFDAPLVRIEKPSLAPGKKHTVDFEYDALGQLSTMTQRGYAPVITGMKHLGRGKNTMPTGQHRGSPPAPVSIARWQPMERRWQYRYVASGPAQGLMHSSDGPLPGSADTHRYSYNDIGQLTRTTAPGGIEAEFGYTRAGQIAEVATSHGKRWQYQYSDAGQLTALRHNGITTKLTRDEQGRIITYAPSDQPAWQLTWSDANLLRRITNDSGSWIEFADATITTKIAQAPPTARIPAQEVAAARNGNGLQTRAAGAIRLWTKRATSEQVMAIFDDFGRRVAAYDSSSGVYFWAYDFADRIIASASMASHSRVTNFQIYQYDGAGQQVGIINSGGHKLTARYQNGKLRQQQERYQTLTWTSGDNMRSTEHTIDYHDPVSGLHFARPITLRREQDEHGRLNHRLLPGGQIVRYHWGKDNRLKAISLEERGGASKTLADHLQWLPFAGGQHGLLAANFGNGTNLRIKVNQRLRIQEVNHSPHLALPRQTLHYDVAGKIVAQQIGPTRTDYQYDANNRLKRANSPDYQQDFDRVEATSAHQRNAAQGRAATRWFTDSNGRIRWAIDVNQQSYRYLYNEQGQRIAKIHIKKPEASRWFVYENQRLLTETDYQGNPLVTYLYLNSKPFAMLQPDQAGGTEIHWIHTDHRGLPLAVTDQSANIVWQGQFTPFGASLERGGRPASKNKLTPIAHKSGPSSRSDAGSAARLIQMPLRLPGQYYDHETGLHDNYLRTYNPATGRYLGPDPLGLRANADRFAYARYSPMDTTDPLGLYEIDVHYNITYFLARVAGIEHRLASIIAHAAQGIDDNPETRPVDVNENGNPRYVSTALNNQQRLFSYHFALSEGAQRADGSWYVIAQNRSTDYASPSSAQLTRLQNSVSSATNGCTQLQLLGEFLHAFQDTFAHRDENNRPIPATILGLGVGHGLQLHHPDYTYNHDENDAFAPLPGEENLRPNWQHNEARTLRMEQEVYDILLRYNRGNPAIPFEQFRDVLREFNRTPENGGDGSGFVTKLGILDSFMATRITVPGDDGGEEPARFLGSESREANSQYVPQRGIQDRTTYLCGQTYSSDGAIPTTCP